MFCACQEWNEDPNALKAWQRGRTGFPLVDAGMRQLWRTGWMQQSIRMVCAAFLTEYLNINWVHGERCATLMGREKVPRLLVSNRPPLSDDTQAFVEYCRRLCHVLLPSSHALHFAALY